MKIRTYLVGNGVKIKATSTCITITSTTGKKTYFDLNGNIIKDKVVTIEEDRGLKRLAAEERSENSDSKKVIENCENFG